MTDINGRVSLSEVSTQVRAKCRDREHMTIIQINVTVLSHTHAIGDDGTFFVRSGHGWFAYAEETLPEEEWVTFAKLLAEAMATK